MEETQKPAAVTTAAEYYAKADTTKVIILPSGLTIKIRKITSREIMRNDAAAIFRSARSISKADTIPEVAQKSWEAMKDTDRIASINASDIVVCMAAIEPRITREKSEGAICIDDINDKDYAELISNVTTFSLGVGASLRPFRTDALAADPRPDGAPIP